MATTPSAFFSEYAAGSDLSFLLANVPDGTLFKKLFDSTNDASDDLEGSKKDDIFYVQPGDVVSGGKGYDVVVEFESSGGTLSDLKLGKTVEAGVLTGDEDADIFGSKEDNNLVGNAGDNALFGKDGKDVLIGNAGDDLLKGGSDKDTLSGGDGNDTLLGGDDKDKLFGMAGDDELFGQDGKDTVLGGPGEDTLFGGQDKDKLTGGDGADVFGFLRKESGVDTITDFEAGVDKIDLTDFNTDFDHLKFKNEGDDVIVTVGKGKNAVKFKLLGYNKDDIDGSFFQF